MRKIAIIRYRDLDVDDGMREFIAKSITEWDEVDDKMFELLQKASRRLSAWGNNFAVLEQLPLSDFIGTKVKEYLDLIQKEKELEQERLKTRAEKKAKREAQKKLKDEEAERKQFELLKKKFDGKKKEE